MGDGLWHCYTHTSHSLVGGCIHTPLKNLSSSVGMMKFPIYGKQNMFQTTNQQVCFFVLGLFGSSFQYPNPLTNKKKRNSKALSVNRVVSRYLPYFWACTRWYLFTRRTFNKFCSLGSQTISRWFVPPYCSHLRTRKGCQVNVKKWNKFLGFERCQHHMLPARAMWHQCFLFEPPTCLGQEGALDDAIWGFPEMGDIQKWMVYNGKII